jgi:hypothetical protein
VWFAESGGGFGCVFVSAFGLLRQRLRLAAVRARKHENLTMRGVDLWRFGGATA